MAARLSEDVRAGEMSVIDWLRVELGTKDG